MQAYTLNEANLARLLEAVSKKLNKAEIALLKYILLHAYNVE